MAIIYKQTLCWDCTNATGACSWSANFTPVKGWDAERIVKPEGVTYQVNACPLFDRDPVTAEERKIRHVRLVGQEVEEEMKEVSGEAWRSEPVTKSQWAYIAAIREDLKIPPFKGRTRGQAADWINEHKKRYVKYGKTSV